MPETNSYKNNPLYADITKLDALSPQPSFLYSWSTGNERWEPFTGGMGGGSLIGGGDFDIKNFSDLVSGLTSGIESVFSKGLGENYKLITKTVVRQINEDFILMEDISYDDRYGIKEGETYGVDKQVLDDVFNVYYENGRTNPSMLETGHVEHFIHSESTPLDRDIDHKETFHTDTRYGIRYVNKDASPINSYELTDFSQLYDEGLADSITIFNDSPYPIQFHTIDKTYEDELAGNKENDGILYLYSDSSVTLSMDEARRIYIKRPHTISGFDITYNITYKETGESDAYNR
jgi:hypothetical protein